MDLNSDAAYGAWPLGSSTLLSRPAWASLQSIAIQLTHSTPLPFNCFVSMVSFVPRVYRRVLDHFQEFRIHFPHVVFSTHPNIFSMDW